MKEKSMEAKSAETRSPKQESSEESRKMLEKIAQKLDRLRERKLAKDPDGRFDLIPEDPEEEQSVLQLCIKPFENYSAGSNQEAGDQLEKRVHEIISDQDSYKEKRGIGTPENDFTEAAKKELGKLQDKIESLKESSAASDNPLLEELFSELKVAIADLDLENAKAINKIKRAKESLNVRENKELSSTEINNLLPSASRLQTLGIGINPKRTKELLQENKDLDLLDLATEITGKAKARAQAFAKKFLIIKPNGDLAPMEGKISYEDLATAALVRNMINSKKIDWKHFMPGYNLNEKMMNNIMDELESVQDMDIAA